MKKNIVYIVMSLLFSLILVFSSCNGNGDTTTPTTTTTTTPTDNGSSIDLTGKIDSAGVLQEDIVVTSDNGVAVLTITKGTKATDSSGNPLSSISIITIESPPMPESCYPYLGLAYNIGPNGATFDKPATLAFTYDPNLLDWTTMDEYNPVVSYYTPEEIWYSMEIDSDFQNYTHSTEIEILGIFALEFMGFGGPVS